MIHEEERVNSARMRNKPERAPPHWLNPFGWAETSSRFDSIICRELRYPSSDNLVRSGELLNQGNHSFSPIIRIDIRVQQVVVGYRMRKQLHRPLCIA